MYAKIKDLDRKYYGTLIEYGENKNIIEIWNTDNYIPSERQLESWEIDKDNQEQWKYAQEWLMCDNHYETHKSYDIAKTIVDALLNII